MKYVPMDQVLDERPEQNSQREQLRDREDR
jgi:hypothetical protein